MSAASRKGRDTRWRCGILAGLALAVLTSPGLIAATWYVDGATGNDANDCQTPASACQTIQAAINKASAGDTINVAAGLYLEPAAGPLTVNKQLTLLGAQAGVDARTRAGTESAISDVQGTSVSANGVVIDGFTVSNSIAPAFTGFGIWLNPGVGGTQILNNIVEDNIVGIGLANLGAQAVIRHNLFRNNNQAGSASGSAIYTDQFVGGPRVENVLIEENTFTGHANAGAVVNISNTAVTLPTNGVFNLQVLSNTFLTNNRAFVLFNTHDSLFDDNTITNSTLAASAAIRILDNNSALTFTNNDLATGVAHAIRLSIVLGLASSDIEFHRNNIGTVGFTSFALTGLTVDPLSHVGTVNAECNWWGSTSGPTAASNPSGAGEEVLGDADFSPWLNAPAPGGACVLPSTPGKVTGGGQIGSDPIFSPLGDLISLPAIVPSLADPTAQATFGFVAKCCAPSGNLQYDDHQADVRIKSQVIDGFLISSPAVSCPATPGSRHATFSGMARVIRPTGTTTEPFTVEVDDCGEPGTSDTFGITTESYANGPSLLIGGNIQIHR